MSCLQVYRLLQYIILNYIKGVFFISDNYFSSLEVLLFPFLSHVLIFLYRNVELICNILVPSSVNSINFIVPGLLYIDGLFLWATFS